MTADTRAPEAPRRQIRDRRAGNRPLGSAEALNTLVAASENELTTYVTGLARLARDLNAAADLEETMACVLAFAHRVIPCDFAGLVVSEPGNTFRVCRPCDPRGALADELQARCGEGPWRSHWSSEDGIVVLDTADDLRWQLWGPQAAQLGVRSLLSIGLHTTRRHLGWLTFYSADPGRFTDADRAAGQLLACHASIAIDAARRAASLMQAVEGRTVIGQAQGILMERFALNADQAFAVLRRYSQDSNTRLRTIAEQIVTTGRLPELRGTASRRA